MLGIVLSVFLLQKHLTDVRQLETQVGIRGRFAVKISFLETTLICLLLTFLLQYIRLSLGGYLVRNGEKIPQICAPK